MTTGELQDAHGVTAAAADISSLSGTQSATRATAATASQPAWVTRLEQTMGMQGEIQQGVLRFTLPTNIIVTFEEGVRSLPNLAQDGYVAFYPEAGGRTFLNVGELVVRDIDNSVVNRVLDALRRDNIHITAVHNHLLNETPKMIYIHFDKIGDPYGVAQAVRNAITASGTPVLKDDSTQDSDDHVALNVKAITTIMQETPTIVDGVLEYTADLKFQVTNYGYPFPGPAGPESEVHFQPIPGGAIVVPEFATTPDRAWRLVDFLRSKGFDVTAEHNHWLLENPRIIFVHAAEQSGSPEFLAQIMRQALDLADNK